MIKPDIQLRLEMSPKNDYIELFAKSEVIENIMQKLSYHGHYWTICSECQESPYSNENPRIIGDKINDHCGSCGHVNKLPQNYTTDFHNNTYYEINDECDFYRKYSRYMKTWSELVRLNDQEDRINLSVLRMVGLSKGVSLKFRSFYTDYELQQFTERTHNVLDTLYENIQLELTGFCTNFKVKMEYNEN